MIVVKVAYNLEVPESRFTCPFCRQPQVRQGGRAIDGQFYPTPREIVEDHLKGEGENRCAKFNTDLDSAEELQISAVTVGP